ncbi:DegT/DnrJ/EryC1/StrS family aminotransferase [Marinimicrobium locisalis]|uniref:DegT/DnrJ/EryC1/StrS family aminotransferase n=1 Tax=Marinimicrobium locisalis TaxID=546022 RepID=UPI0032219284
MDTLRALSEGVLPPAGNRIALSTAESNAVQSLFPDRVLSWTNSGTSALALALLAIRRDAPEVDQPEVIIPAYCCPDLVSAALYAGYTPVFSDLAKDRCHYDQEALKRALSERTLAVIAINFLGVAEPIKSLRVALNRPSVAIIEDNAQWFPSKPQVQTTAADYQTFSFGRGKPVNLLGGGLLVSSNDPPRQPGTAKGSALQRGLYYGKCMAYNTLLHPTMYQALARNPWLRLGETRYHEHTSIEAFPAGQAHLVRANIQTYWSHERRAEKSYRKHLAAINLLAPQIEASEERLLRYPLLLESRETRNALLHKLNERGLGATTLYSDTIDRVNDVPQQRLRQAGDNANAASFAQRFLTLPVHEGVKAHHIERTLTVIDCVVG